MRNARLWCNSSECRWTRSLEEIMSCLWKKCKKLYPTGHTKICVFKTWPKHKQLYCITEELPDFSISVTRAGTDMYRRTTGKSVSISGSGLSTQWRYRKIIQSPLELVVLTWNILQNRLQYKDFLKIAPCPLKKTTHYFDLVVVGLVRFPWCIAERQHTDKSNPGQIKEKTHLNDSSFLEANNPGCIHRLY